MIGIVNRNTIYLDKTKAGIGLVLLLRTNCVYDHYVFRGKDWFIQVTLCDGGGGHTSTLVDHLVY
jgi:hypothetical protein